MMDRAEATGFGIAFAGHAALLGALTLGFAAVTLPTPKNDPIEVSFVDEAALQSTAPVASTEAPAPQLAEIEGPVEASEPPPLVEPVPAPEPLPQPRVEPRPAPPAPTPRPTPRPVSRAQPPQRPAPQPKPAPPKAAAPKAAQKAGSGAQPQPRKGNAPVPTGRLKGISIGSDAPSPGRAATPPAAKASAAVQASLGAELKRQLKPHWRSPTGADVEQLVTTVTVSLARDGSVASIGEIRTTGQTPSNRSQVKLHQEHAVRAIRLAAPFRFPTEYYDAWKVIRPNFDRRL